MRQRDPHDPTRWIWHPPVANPFNPAVGHDPLAPALDDRESRQHLTAPELNRRGIHLHTGGDEREVR